MRIKSGDLAATLSLSRQTITYWISGKRMPSVDHAKMLDALGFSKTAVNNPSKKVKKGFMR